MTSAVALPPSFEETVQQQPSSSKLVSALFFGVFSLLLFGPLAFGAVEPWAILTLEAGAALLFVVWTLQQIACHELKVVGNPLFLPMLAFGVVGALQLALGQTAYHTATFSSVLLYSCYGLQCFLVVQCLRRTWQVKTLAIGYSGYGFALAMFALVQDLASNRKLYWLRTPRFGGWIYGPYVNHNHYAGLMEMLAPIPLVLALSPHVSRFHRGMAALAAALMASTIFLSGSRGGMVAFAVQIAVLLVFLHRRRRRGAATLAFGAFLIIAFAFLAWLGGGQLADRMASIRTETATELSGGVRLQIDRDAIKMFARKPVLGWGLGTFADVYPQFRRFYTNAVVDHAHNDYVQLLVETGTLGFAVMLWFLFAVYRAAIPKSRTWPADTDGAVALATILGITGIVVHSFLDFNLQIPANAVFFYVLCAVASMEPRFGSHGRKRRNRESSSQPSSQPFAIPVAGS